ncbi:MAG: hypothetical protein KDD41_11105 [Flavobacteriales bacterium]|nr:hypothetical protein [Flavobacteriales bacterium]
MEQLKTKEKVLKEGTQLITSFNSFCGTYKDFIKGVAIFKRKSIFGVNVLTSTNLSQEGENHRRNIASDFNRFNSKYSELIDGFFIDKTNKGFEIVIVYCAERLYNLI